LAISAKSSSLRPGSSTTEPALTFIPLGRNCSKHFAAAIASAFDAAGSCGRPGACTPSPADTTDVIPPWTYESRKSTVFCRGV
jgi:hypothetical protein